MIKFATEKVNAIRFEVVLPDDVQKYALNWLNICNNVRENEELLTCYNNSGKSVFVICKKDAAPYVEDWLQGFGKVIEKEQVECIQPFLVDHLMTEDEMDNFHPEDVLPAYVGLGW